MTQRAIIVGGGIGGLTAALALQRIGWQLTVLEQAPAIAEVGAGLQLSPNGVRLLERLGVMHRLEAAVFEPESLQMCDGLSGERIFELPMRGAAEQRWGARYLQVHRADLIEALRQSLLSRQADAIHTGERVSVLDEDTGEVYTEAGHRFGGDLIIGADGIHSVIREQLCGPDRAQFTGNVAWRAVVPRDQLGPVVPPPGGCIWAGPGRHVVTSWLRAGQLANFVGVVEQDDWHNESWRETGSSDRALADFEGWHPAVTGLIARAEVLNRWALYVRGPLPHWHRGRVVLLGDAAHPMLPSMAQGAVQAIEDAWVLMRCLERAPGVEPALDDYFRTRIDRVNRIQRLSADNVRLFHARHAITRALTRGPARLAACLAPGLLRRRYDWIYRYDPG